MTSEGRRDSLADQAAAWIPPWERPAPAPPIDPEGPTTPVDPADPVALNEPVALEEPADRTEEAVPDVPDESTDPAGSDVSGQPAEPADPVAPDEPAPPRSVAATGGPGRAARTTPPTPLDDDELRGALEAILLVVDEPVAEAVLAQTLEQPVARVRAALKAIAEGYTAGGHGFELRRAAGGWRLYTRPEYASYVERFVLDGQSVRLTQAALETLAVVAYKQPVTRSRISAIRGVNCDGVVRTLVTRGLIEECGTEPDSGAFLYRTTRLFLEKLGLDSVDELPPLAPFLPDDVEELTDAPR